MSYTYEPSTNSGTVIVADQQHPTAVLCNPIYITAASWNYTNSAVWPQALNLAKTNYLTVSKVGTYAFGAEVTCGQGDIYAQSNSYIIPTPTLEGPASWERFLSSLGLDTTTPGSSYMLTSLSCVHILPVTSVVTGACYWDNERGSSSKTIKIQYDNRQSNVAVDFSIASGTNPVVDNSAYDRTVAAGKVVDVTVPTSGTEGARYTVLAAGAKTNLTVASYEACPPEITTLPLVQPAPVSFLDTCGVAGDKVVIPTLTSEDHFRYSTAETTTSADVRTVTVTAVPEKGYGFGSDATTLWSHTFKTDAQSNCVTVPGDPEAVGQSCAVAADGVVSGYLTVAPVTGVGYTIHPVAPTGADITVTGSKTDVVPGDYLIIAMAEPGFILTGEYELNISFNGRFIAGNIVELSETQIGHRPDWKADVAAKFV